MRWLLVGTYLPGLSHLLPLAGRVAVNAGGYAFFYYAMKTLTMVVLPVAPAAWAIVPMAATAWLAVDRLRSRDTL